MGIANGAERSIPVGVPELADLIDPRRRDHDPGPWRSEDQALEHSIVRLDLAGVALDDRPRGRGGRQDRTQERQHGPGLPEEAEVAGVRAIDRPLAEEHYGEHVAKPFFGELVEFITGGPLVAMVLEGHEAVKAARQVIGATNPLEAAPGSIRGDFAVETGR